MSTYVVTHLSGHPFFHYKYLIHLQTRPLSSVPLLELVVIAIQLVLPHQETQEHWGSL